ncbi:hypothetical protein BC939DRAFT_443145 [Gamsiella multidivaricata]|uniref:uncharacterized protein n=1 Tax=Gamsiella multidivaricata TaxID=101098 RepID=UPI00221F1F9E|nr:uncharacterized protein BC939DRAFT_443145 [Gamsiella multidivaricata]KAI7828523.1 hypothetical protein BC939DRAFT_443145 [Gamsiella multidivaricata]
MSVIASHRQPSSSMNPYSEFTCLYTSQKLKKAKTWHDGHLRHFHNNSKVVLYDTKFGVLDSTFRRGVAIAVGDDMDMDKHLVTVEDLTVAYATNSGDQRQISHSTPTPAPATLVRRTPAPLHRSVATKTSIMATSSAVSTMRSTALSSPSNNAKHPANGSASSSSELVNQTTLQQGNDGESVSLVTIPQETKRKKWRSPFTNTAPPTASSWSSSGGDWESIDYQEIQEAFPSTMDEEEELRHTVTETDNALSKAVSSARITTTNTTATLATATTTARPAPKRRKVGLSRVPNAISSSIQLTMGSPHRPPSTQLEFPNAARCTNFTGKNSNQLLRRSLALGARFMSTNQYKDGMSFLIYEHLQLVVIESAIAMWSMKTNANMSEGESLDAQYRSRGIHMHSGSTLRRRGDAYPGFPVYSERSFKGADPPGASVALVQPATQQGATLSVTNKEHHSKYSKDDLWVVSTTLRFDTASTFFARSIFYGPSGSDVELLCLSQKDSNAARNILANGNQVCAIRLFNAMSEFMMLDNLSENLTRTPLLPALLNYVPPELVKASKASIFKAPSRIPEKSGCIVLTDEDGIEVELEIREAIAQYRLNEEQATVLRNFAQAVIRAPGWVQKSSDSSSVLLVHGVFGAGKSFLIAVLIVFIDNIINKARPLPREERSCRFLVASMTNVAVDRILTVPSIVRLL